MYNTISDEEIKLLLSAAKRQSSRNFTMIFLALSTGLRVSELVGLFIEDVRPFEEVSKILTVPSRIGKGGKSRDIPLNDDTRSIITDFIRIKGMSHQFTNSDSFLFVSKSTKKPLSTRDFQRIVKNLSVHSINRSISPHTLRHTFATRLLKHTNLRVIQETLGHAWLNTTMLYTHPDKNDCIVAIDKLKLPSTII